jgi:ribulose-5-phosphate 4-epimerase/fuculose-1-phosphate aldolase
VATLSSAAGAGLKEPPTEAVVGYALAGRVDGPLAAFAEQLGLALEAAGFTHVDDPADAGLVLNLIDADAPKPFRRKSRGTFVAALYEQPVEPEDGLRQSYPLLVRALANVVLCYVPSSGVSFTTMERGHYRVEANGGPPLAVAVAERLLPLARSRLVIDNEFCTDLEPELWDGDQITEQIGTAGRRLDALGLLPAPFPIEELLDERDLRHVSRLYGIGGLSYGNLSARKDARRFWMSASGVDKSQLDEAGRDILLVSGYDPAEARMILSVPPNVEPRRVSVDAIEHWIIYREHPDVNAILHVHAWMDGIAATDINYPCGTAELAGAVAALLAEEPDPAHAVIGLRNHGITATGESLGEILDRIEPSLLKQVPMT